MKRKTMMGSLITLVILVAVCMLFVILLGTNEKLGKQELLTYKSIEDLKNTKMEDAFKKVIDKTDRKVNIEFTEQEVNEMIALIFTEYEKDPDSLKITGYKSEIIDKKIKVSFDSYFYKVLPVQYVFEVIPSIENNKISLFLSSAKIGKISISPKTVLEKLKMQEKEDYFVDMQKQSIVLINKYPEQIIFKSVEVDEEIVRIEMALSINTLKDLVSVLGTIMSEDLQTLIDKVPIDDIKDIAVEQIKDIALSQISNISSSIKDEAIESLSNYAKNAIMPEKLVEVFTKENVTTIIDTAKDVVVGNSSNSSSKNETKQEPTIIETVKETLIEEVKKQIDKQDENSKVKILKTLLDNYTGK